MIPSKLLRKTLLGDIIIFLILTVSISGFLSWNLYREFTQEYENRGFVISSSIAESSLETFLNRDASTIQATVDQFLDEDGGVHYVFVVDEHGEIIAHTFVPSVPEELVRLKDELMAQKQSVIEEGYIINHLNIPEMGDFMDISSPILAGVAGRVHVGMSKSVINAKIMSAIAKELLIIFVIFLGSIIFDYFRVRRVSLPLRQLTESTAAVAAGDLDRRVEVRSDDELGLLATSFNQMVANLKAARDAVNEQQRLLEARSADLERTLNELRESVSAREQLSAMVRELSSPVVPILDDILVMPLIGIIDTERADLLIDSLLKGIERYRARVVIIDMTGVPLVDTYVARVLLQVAGAAQLLGTETVLVGLRPELAETIVALGLDLSRITTRADLRSGVSYALQLSRNGGTASTRSSAEESAI
ncbi:MAG: hypothetical protein KatS3mg057_2711 [Herpetosiphonaceae bacterium]|nr:MAG: hypothetical protein KatS3mg057_2711 [Herpetosiphonaceae bacterium]